MKSFSIGLSSLAFSPYISSVAPSNSLSSRDLCNPGFQLLLKSTHMEPQAL
jgi:hypothetical protein